VDKINLNDWMGTDTTAANASADLKIFVGPFIVPKNIALTINAKADKVKYDKVDYDNVSGNLR
jgi:hypothetical protein